MKVNRLVIFTRLADRKHYNADEDVTAIGDAINGLPEADLARRELESGKQVKRCHVLGGIEIKITLTPSSAVNRTGLANAKRIGRLV